MKNIYDALNRVKVDMGNYEITPLTELEEAAMKKNIHATVKKHRPAVRWTAVAACAALVVCFSQTAFAKTAIEGILQAINLGHNSVVQVDPAKEKKPNLSGYYDKNGKPLTSLNPNGKTNLYDAKGNKIGSVSNGKKGEDDADAAVEKDLSKAVSQLSFQPLLPKDLPKGYAFNKAVFYKDDNGKVSGDYVDLYYTSGSNQIYIQERRITDGTTYTFATDGNVQKATVNGHVAAITNGHSIDWESGGVSIHISAKALSTEELTKLATSMK